MCTSHPDSSNEQRQKAEQKIKDKNKIRMKLWREDESRDRSLKVSATLEAQKQVSTLATSDPPWHHIKLKKKGINARANVVLSTKT